ncbi:MAG: hypothetical protein MSA18_04140 [Succinivibrio sp.]|nr:hypothetical protein [Succinivibrio sp.]MCI6906474.1 hypothetical protein [Succinatimonas sp.]
MISVILRWDKCGVITSYSIANGFGFGFVSFCLLKLFTKRYKEVTPVMWIVTIIFVISFIMHG